MRQIPFIVVAACAVFLLSGCAKKPQDAYGLTSGAASGAYGLTAGAAPETRMLAAPAFEATANQATRRSDSLAYEHVVSIVLSKELLPTRLREIESACATDKEFDCTILEVSVSSDEDIPSGNIRMRLAPGGVDSIIGLASKDGKWPRGIRARKISPNL